MAQVDLDDLGRLPVFEKLLAFVEQYPAIRKGLYLYGDFGVGKSFMVAALAHDLSEKRGVSSTLLHYPSFVIDVKNAIGDGNVKTLVDEIKLSEVLILDDIGAEQSTAWVRDEILQVILQYRMQEDLPTFSHPTSTLMIWSSISLKGSMEMMKPGKLEGSWNASVIWLRRLV